MSTLVENGYKIFTDVDGDPLENGYIYIGVAGLNPISNPLQAYWDAALTVPASNIRTKGGYPDNNGTPGKLYVENNYSILVRDKHEATVYTNLNAVDYTNIKDGSVIYNVDTIADLRDLIPPGEPYKVQLSGYYTQGDGGAGPVRYWDSTSVVADNGGSVIKPTAIAGAGRWLMEWSGAFNVKWFGIKGDNIQDETSIFTTMFAAGLGTIEGNENDNYKITAALTIPINTHFKGYSCNFTVTGAIAGSIFTIENTGSINDCDINTVAATGFDAVLELVPEPLVGRIIISNAYDWARNITMLGNSAGKIGDAILLDAITNVVADGSIQLTTCSNIKANYYENGIHLKAVGPSWCNSNIFRNCEMSRTTNAINEDAPALTTGAMAANVYDHFTFQWETGDYGVKFHSRAQMHSGLIWDGGTIEFVESNNRLYVFTSSAYTIVDNGSANKIHSHQYEYRDKFSSFEDDNRPWIRMGGRKEFIDEFNGSSLIKPWVENSVGVSTISPSNTLRGGTNPFLESGLYITTGAITNDSFEMTFDGGGGIVPAFNPVLHVTNRWQATTDEEVFIGLWKDSNNYIGIEAGAYLGNLELVCRVGGVETRKELLLLDDGVTPLPVIWTRLYFLTLKVSDDKVTAVIGTEVYNSTNLYQAKFLQSKATTSYSAEITTNIPVDVVLEPRVYVKTLTAASVNVLMMDMQLLSAKGYNT
jgi:hypothetical protein